MLASRGAVALDAGSTPHSTSRQTRYRINTEHEPPTLLTRTIKYAPLPAGVGGKVGTQIRPARLNAWRQDHARKRLVNAVVADADTKAQWLRRCAIDATVDSHARRKCAAERNREHEDETARRDGADRRARLAEQRHVGNFKCGRRRSRFRGPHLTDEIDDANGRAIGTATRRSRQQRESEHDRHNVAMAGQG